MPLKCHYSIYFSNLCKKYCLIVCNFLMSQAMAVWQDWHQFKGCWEEQGQGMLMLMLMLMFVLYCFTMFFMYMGWYLTLFATFSDIQHIRFVRCWERQSRLFTLGVMGREQMLLGPLRWTCINYYLDEYLLFLVSLICCCYKGSLQN